MEKTNIKVVKVLPDNENLVINIGSKNGARMGLEFLVYEIGEEIVDPDTGEGLGNLEIIKGRGIITHVQERMSTITSIENVKETRASVVAILGQSSTSNVVKPFKKPKVGDLLKPIK